MEILLHPPEDAQRHRPDPRGRLSTRGHRAAFRAFARVAARSGVRFMVIGGTFRDIAVRASSTRDIDVVVADRVALPEDRMQQAGFTPVPGAPHAWRYVAGECIVDLEIAAIASSEEARGPFSIALQHAEVRKIEGVKVAVPRVEDYVILKLVAAADNRKRRGRDLVDVQFTLEAFHEESKGVLGIPALRARMRDLYGFSGQRLKDLVALLRTAHRVAALE